MVLERAGRWTEAHQANQEAIGLYRRRAADDPRFRTGLAVALTNTTALTLRGAGEEARHDVPAPPTAGAPTDSVTPGDGTGPAFEAVRTWRELAAADPGHHEADLAIALLNLRTQLAHAGRHDEAVAAIAESVELYRRLADDNPLTYQPPLATALGLLRASLTDAGDHDHAVEAGNESVAVWRRLADKDPAAHQTGLLGGLHGQNDTLRAAGLPEDPEAHARSPRVRLDDGPVLRPAITIAVQGWGCTSPPLTTRDDILRTAEHHARRGDWPAYWEAVCRSCLTDAARLARRIPRRRWNPSDAVERDLLDTLRSLPGRRTAALLAAAAADATSALPPRLELFNEDYVSFAHGRRTLAVAAITDDHQEAILTLGLPSGGLTTLHTGPPNHFSIACIDASEVVAIRQTDHGGPTNELVRHSTDGTVILARGDAVGGARVVATSNGYVVGLRLGPTALVDDGPGPLHPDGLRQVDLRPWGLTRGDLIAVDPTGERLVFCDGHVLVATDSRLRRALAVGGLVQPDAVSDLVFVGRHRLLTSGRGGGLTLWQFQDHRILPVLRQDTPPLQHLFAVPEWNTVGGKAHSEGRVHYHDALTLAPRTAPPALTDSEHLTVLNASPDGRFVAYGGQLAVGEPRSRRSFDWHSRVHDLDHPGAVLQRPLTGLRPDAVENLRRAARAARLTGDARLLELLALALALAHRPPDD
ncbi:tetratricopeptide repeat protein [Streptomyces sp. CB01881]|uniref:tetratricopeptide repeat protein n=1 Tax=Streptomyces sp. CB01881 TaxID=2078691 RepID=UPI0011DF4D1B|nr:tetratricopeptide repeat protein [Streptomyces sp. CB01881]TYC66676.1 tetratricopeptide repeat protein [Streptomyces sp. CB01881]